MTHLGRRFAFGDRMLRFARTVGRTSRLSVASRAWTLRLKAIAERSKLGRTLRELGPYTAIALVLPGGSLIALAAWTFRHRSLVAASLGRVLVMAAVFGAALILPGKM